MVFRNLSSLKAGYPLKQLDSLQPIKQFFGSSGSAVKKAGLLIHLKGDIWITMVAVTSSHSLALQSSLHQAKQALPTLLQGEILLTVKPHTAWGAAVTAQMYIPTLCESVWRQITDYPRWVEFLPALSRSQVVPGSVQKMEAGQKLRIQQTATKDFWLFSASADVELEVFELPDYQVQFQLRSGNFTDFTANLQLQDLEGGTWLCYSVQATPSIPIPSIFIQQAIQLDLPANLRQLRKVLCQ